jgi:hypothetical protein
MDSTADISSIGLPASKELASLFQDEFSGSTGMPVRWAAERVQGNRRLERSWRVPFTAEGGSRGSFSLHWDSELERFMASRIGPNAGRPEYMGAILRATAGRWASWHALRAATQVRLEPTPHEDVREETPLTLGRSSAALIIDSFVIELVFALESHRD